VWLATLADTDSWATYPLCPYRPLVLELAATDEAIVRDHMDIFRFNGFECEYDEMAPAGRRVRLLAVPYSRNTSFGPRG